jgi:hypothetical protein
VTISPPNIIFNLIPEFISIHTTPYLCFLAKHHMPTESTLMQPRALLASNDQPLARARGRLNELLENNYELAVRRLTLRGPMFGRPNDTSKLAAGGCGEEGRVLKDLAGFGMFVYKSWGGLFRSRGWIK